MEIVKEDIKIDKISELLRKCRSDDGTFLDSLYNIYLFIGITKGVDDIRNGRGMTLEEFERIELNSKIREDEERKKDHNIRMWSCNC